jgi:hypothetical protein
LPANGRDVWFTTPDGVKLHGWFISASTKAPAVGTILYAHGNGGNLSNVGWLGERLAMRGFDVLLFDYRGYGRSEGRATDEHALYTDTEAAYDYLLRERSVAPARLILYGHSLGTTAVVDVAARRPVAALVVESGLASASAMATEVLPWLPRWLHWLGRNRFDSAAKLQRVNCPVLITHGDPDRTIPAAQAYALYAAAHEPKRLIIMSGAGHNVTGICGDRYLDTVADILRTALAQPQTVHGTEVDAALCAR